MFRKRGFWIGLIVLLALAGGGYAYYHYVYQPGQETTVKQTISTAQVQQGDVVVSVSGAGELNPSAELAVGFQAGGYLDEVLVEVGDRVQAGDVLARLETDDLELAVAEADIKARLAQLSLDDADEEPSDAELADAQADLRNAQYALTLARYTYDSALNSDLDAAVRSRYLEYQWATERYLTVEQRQEQAVDPVSQDDFDAAWNERGTTEGAYNEVLQEAQMEALDAANQVDQNQNRVYQAQASLELLQSGPTTDTIVRAELSLDQAVLALENARDDLAAAELRAPFDATVVSVDAIPGEHVGTATFITLADLAQPLLCLWVEESDMSGVVVGNRVEIVFEALPDDVFSGEIVRVDPALVTVDGTLTVQAWASIDVSSRQVNLLGGMNADVEVISAESRDTFLVPLQALRELGADQYAVFVVQPDGEMVLRPVEVGLRDFVYAEILSGLELGETISTGVEESTEVEVPEQEMMMPGGGMMMPGGGGPPGGP